MQHSFKTLALNGTHQPRPLSDNENDNKVSKTKQLLREENMV